MLLLPVFLLASPLLTSSFPLLNNRRYVPASDTCLTTDKSNSPTKPDLPTSIPPSTLQASSSSHPNLGQLTLRFNPSTYSYIPIFSGYITPSTSNLTLSSNLTLASNLTLSFTPFDTASTHSPIVLHAPPTTWFAVAANSLSAENGASNKFKPWPVEFRNKEEGKEGWGKSAEVRAWAQMICDGGKERGRMVMEIGALMRDGVTPDGGMRVAKAGWCVMRGDKERRLWVKREIGSEHGVGMGKVPDYSECEPVKLVKV